MFMIASRFNYKFFVETFKKYFMDNGFLFLTSVTLRGLDKFRTTFFLQIRQIGENV